MPAALAYYVAAVLVLLPGTRPIRLTLMPLILWSLFRAATSIDIGAACGDPGYDFYGYGLCVSGSINHFRADPEHPPSASSDDHDYSRDACNRVGFHPESFDAHFGGCATAVY